MSGKMPNEGEGSRSGARAYNEATKKHSESGKVEQEAKDAEKAYEGKEGEELRKAEEEGRSRSHGEDPAVKR
jgi:hypothetical protein